MNIIMIILASLSFIPFAVEPYKQPPYIKMADEISAKVAKRMERKHHIKLIGEGGEMMRCVKVVGLSFQIYRPLTKSEARALVVDVAQNLLAEFNQNEAIRPYLEVYPFDEKHVKIFLFIKTPKGGEFYYPDLSVVTASMGDIDYSTNDPDTTKFDYKTEEVETFEDAVKILKGETPNP